MFSITRKLLRGVSVKYSVAKYNVTQMLDNLKIITDTYKYHLSKPGKLIENLSNAKLVLQKSLLDKKNIELNLIGIKHINLADSANIKDEDRGNVFVKEAPSVMNLKPLLRQATSLEIKDFNVFAIGGLDFDSYMHLSALINNVRKLAPSIQYDSGGKVIGLSDVIAIFPEVTRQERYQAALEFSLNPKNYPEYIEERVKKYILPKILNDDGKIVVPNKPMTIFSFSVGGREVLMMERALIDILKNEYDLSDLNIKKLFASFRGISIAYAVDPKSIHENGFTKFIIYSADDVGALMPNKFYGVVLSDSEEFDNMLSHWAENPENVVFQNKPKLNPIYKYDLVKYIDYNNVSGQNILSSAYPQVLIILNNQIVSKVLEGKTTHNFHSLPHYIAGIKTGLSKLEQESIKSLLTYSLCSDDEIIAPDTFISHPLATITINFFHIEISGECSKENPTD